jgi:predicted nucleic acid-binding protein
LIVLDASVVIELLMGTAEAESLCRRILDPLETRHAPELLDVEVSQVVRRYWLAGEIDPYRGQEMIVDLADLPIIRHSHSLLLQRIWELRTNLSAYDAAYVAVAEALDAPLLTRDARLASVRDHDAAIELL